MQLFYSIKIKILYDRKNLIFTYYSMVTRWNMIT